MCRQLLRGGIPGLHFYTLNLEVSAPAVLHTLSLIKASLLLGVESLLISFL
jgi:5,10-methylenetetrahydrofolate reductase